MRISGVLVSGFRRFWLAGLVLLTILLLGTNAFPQALTGTLSGTVYDQSGAVVPRAKVTLVNPATGDARGSTSNDVGYFNFTGVNPGTYTVKVEMAGFKAWRRAEIVMHPGDTRSLSDIALQIGNPTDVISVEAVAGEVAPVDSGERSDVITSNEIQQLSLQGRNLTELLKILPGVATTAPGLANGSPFNFLNVGAQGSSIGTGLNANGSPNRGGTALLSDGADIIDPGCNCWSVATVNPDFTQEVKVQTSNFGADNPKGPVVVNNIGKSGTNTYHGGAYLYARHNVLNANDWADNHTLTAKGLDHYYYPGGQFGGPVPGTHKKLLFFFGYEHFLQNTGNSGSLTSSIPTASMLAGDFTPTNADNQAACPNGFSSTATDWCNNLAGTILPDGTVVPDNLGAGYKIPSQFLDPGSAALAKVFPAPNVDPNLTGGFNYKQTFPADHNGYIYRARVDYNFSDNTKFYFSWQYGNDSQLAQGTGAHMWWQPGNAIAFPGGGIQSLAYSKTATGHFIHVFSPTLTNEFSATWGWGNSPLSADLKAVSRSTLGYSYSGIFKNPVTMIPSFDCSSCGGRQLPDFSQADVFEKGSQFVVRKEMPAFSDSLTKVYRTHTLKFGAYYERVGNYQGNYLFPNGYINQWSGQNNNLFTGNKMGSPNNRVANFAMGIANGYNESNSLPYNDIAYKTISAYVDDSWKTTKRLTIDVGFRFEHIGHWYDRQGNGVAVFIPNLVNSDFASARLFPGLRWHAIDPGVPNSGEPNRFAWVSPRFGMAWDLFGTGKTVLRGGWGAYRWNDQYNDFANALGPGQGVLQYNLPGGSNVLLSQIGSITVPPATWSPSSVSALSATDEQIPVTYSYSFTVSQRLPARSLLEVAYVGSKSEHTLMGGQSGAAVSGGDFANVNKTALGALFGADPLTGITAPNPEDVGHDLTGGVLPNSYSDYRPFGVFLGPGALNGQSIYGTNSITVPTHVGYSNYNGLQTSWIKQSGRLTFDLNYTWSKALGTGLNIDPFTVHGNYGALNIDRPHVINTSYTYNIPGFRNGSKALSGATDGWTISGVTTWQAGGNLQALDNPNFSMSLQYVNNPSTISNALSTKTYFGTDAGSDGGPGMAIMPALTCNPGSGLTTNEQAKLSCFSAPAFQTQGARNFPYLHGAAYFNTDLSLYKTFHVTERQALQFRISAFNFLNHPLLQFSGSDQLLLAFNEDYNTHAISLNQSGLKASGKPWGFLNYKSGYPSQRIMELAVKYTF